MPRARTCAHRRALTGLAVLALLATGGTARPAAALDALTAELLPLEEAVVLHRLYLVEIERQGRNRVDQLSAWIGWWTKIQGMATETADKLAKSLEERIRNAERAGALLGGLLKASPPDQRAVPHVGWHDTVTIAVYANELRKELAAIRDLAAKGQKEWHIAAVGWITGQGIQWKIDDLLRQQREIQDGIRDGTHQVLIAGAGWTTGGVHRRAIEDLERRQKELRDLVAAGDYVVQIPGLGPRSRKTIDAEIAAAEAELAGMRETLARGELQIHRPPTGYVTLVQLRERLAADALSFEVMQKTVADGVYNVWIADAGWATGVDLDGRLKAYEADLANLQDQIAQGDYRPQLPVGWATRKDIEAALESLNAQLARPEVDAKTRAYLAEQVALHRKSLAELQAISAYDIAIRQAESSKLRGWRTDIMRLARPDFERRAVERAEREATLAEFPIEGALWLKPIEMRIARLRTARQMIPGG